MPDFSWLASEDSLSSEALTVVAQAVDPTDRGRLTHDVYFSRRDVDSVKLAEINDLDYRPVSDRREWNARGRKIPVPTPPIKELEMVPIEAQFDIGEYEQQRLAERTLGNETLFREIVGISIPERTESLALANLRRIEVEAFEAWANGQITAMNPETATTQTMSFGFDAARYPTAATAWDDVGLNAYNELISFLRTAMENIGSLGGVLLRQATLLEILADSPNPISPNPGDIEPTQAQVEDRVSQVFGTRFVFVVNEESFDIFDDAGMPVTRTKVWPAQHVAAIPENFNIGQVNYAPVLRAMEMARSVPEAGINIRGQTAYTEISGNGRHLAVEVQVNAMPVPNEQMVYVIDAGV